MSESPFCKPELSTEILKDISLLGSQRISDIEIKEDVVTTNKITTLTTKIPLLQFDVFYPKGIKGIKYYVRNFLGFTKKALHTYEIRRADGNSITSLDLSLLRKGRHIILSGSVSINKTTCKIK